MPLELHGWNFGKHKAETGPPAPIDLANHRVHRRAILDGLTSEYQIAS
ncbi:hypothetical protein [Acrocarpospora catenulata]|nr:hypothetical protein [Acrocarpospora catenulata]